MGTTVGRWQKEKTGNQLSITLRLSLSYTQCVSFKTGRQRQGCGKPTLRAHVCKT